MSRLTNTGSEPDRCEREPTPPTAPQVRDFVVIKVAYPSAHQARDAALDLVSRHLIASGQATPIDSMYWWQGEIHNEPEHELTCYTRTALFPAIELAIKATLPYDVAQIVAVPLAHTTKDFAAWIQQSTATVLSSDRRR